MPIEITVPGSKSIANRALLLAALLDKDIKIENIPECDDTISMIRCLEKLKNSKGSPIKLFTGDAGTTTRFLTAFSTLRDKEIIISGSKRMNERPIKPLSDALNELGANIQINKSCPPLHIAATKLKGGKISIPGNISSQYISALLMVAPFTEEKTTINIDQELCSKPYIEMTIKVMKAFGIETTNNKFEQLSAFQTNDTPTQFMVENDASSASYAGAYAALHPEKTITLKNISKDSIQGDIKFLQYLEKMGCKITHDENETSIKGPETLKSLGTIDMNSTPDLVMTFAALAMLTPGTTTINNIGNLRIKETDRLKALESEIENFGIKIRTGKDFIEIEGDPKLPTALRKKVSVKTYNDHRIAMCFGILTDIIPQIEIENPKCVAKSYPTFWEDLNTLQNG